uniref:Sulfotransfer_1 domain-containing protein n=1 Tax=Parastrongyloides trichosuri TaxID=131310 RepID=A0A0N5A2A4_PARTI
MHYIWILFSTILLIVKSEQKRYTNSTTSHSYKIYSKGVVREAYYVVPKYNLATCVVHKSFSSMLTGILCYLYMEKKFNRSFNHISGFTFKYDKCTEKIRYSSFKNMARAYHSTVRKNETFYQRWKVIMVVRHPIERFISGFSHFCLKHKGKSPKYELCLGCKSDVKCFVNRLQSKVNSKYRNMVHSHDGMKMHFFPQTMQCKYYKNKNKFVIIKYESKNLDKFYNSLEDVLRRQSVPEEKVSYIDKEIRTHRVGHSTTGKEETIKLTKNIMNDRTLLKKLIEIYYTDFKEFNFPFPNISS